MLLSRKESPFIRANNYVSVYLGKDGTTPGQRPLGRPDVYRSRREIRSLIINKFT
jgi:hypothetical protein